MSENTSNTSSVSRAGSQRAPMGSLPSIPVVGIGASAGGVTALQRFFESLPEGGPAGLDMAFVVVFHLPPDADSSLASLLQKHTSLSVEEVREGTEVRPGQVYIAAPGTRVEIEDVRLRVIDAPPSVTTSTIDSFFRSLAADLGQSAAGIVLSGMGSDGTVGLRAIKEEGGLTMVQDPREAEHGHMPQSALAAAQVDVSLPASELAPTLVEYFKNAGESIVQSADAMDSNGQSAFQGILSVVEAVTGHSFSSYKRPVVLHRIQRRMQIHSHRSLEEYLEYLQNSDREPDRLYRELLIGVTSFFRSPAAFEALAETVIPELVEQRGPDQQLRIWVPACATGEEAYSLAILFQEYADTLDPPPDIQIFATDVNENALEFGRRGLYPASVREDLTPERLNRFFETEGDHYRIKHFLREQVLFAKHDLLTDPPFSNLNLISCRNLLIYLDEETQKGTLELFHFGLRARTGVLFLGGKESTKYAAPFFSSADETHSILRVDVDVSRRGLTAGNRRSWREPQAKAALRESRYVIEGGGSDRGSSRELGDYRKRLVGLLRHRVFSRDTACVLVDARHHILEHNEAAGVYLRSVDDEQPKNLTESVADSLRSALTSLLNQVREQREPVRRSGVEVPIGDETHAVALAVYPVGSNNASETPASQSDPESPLPFLLVRFEDASPDAGSTKGEPARGLQEKLDRLHDQITLATQREQKTDDDLEAANEELLSMNEELHTMNEELHAKNHELATRREELKATNEELKATNEQLREKAEEIEETNSALEALIAAPQIASLFLDADLQLQRATPQGIDFFDVGPSDVGLPLSELEKRFGSGTLTDDAERVLATHQTIDREVRPDSETWLLVRIRPYFQGGDRVSGVVLTLVDVTQHRMLEQKLVNASERVRREIGQELHDVLSSDLAAIAMKTENIVSRLEDAGSTEVEPLESVVEMMREAASKSRTLSHELIPAALQEEHLAAALESLCNEQEEMSGIPCRFVGNREESLPANKETAMHLYRIAREAIVNAQQHADPNEIRVDLHRRDGNLVLRIRDDGTGLPDNLNEVEGVGLRSMRHRANLVAASLTIGTGSGAETVVRCALPLEQARAR